MHNRRWLIYALGGGYGHFTRALSLARAAKQAGQTVEILYNSELAMGLAKNHLKDTSQLLLTPISYQHDKEQVASLISKRLLNHAN